MISLVDFVFKVTWLSEAEFPEVNFVCCNVAEEIFPDGVSAAWLEVNFLWENATFTGSNHKYNPIKGYYVNVNREEDKTRQWNVSLKSKWVDFSGHKAFPIRSSAAVTGGTCKPGYWLKSGEER